MKFAYILTAIAQVTSAHYFFDTNIINGVAQTPGKYVRTSTRATKYNPIKFSSNPAADIRDNSFVDGPDIRCNQGAFSSAGKTEVLNVTAGSEVRFKLGVGATMAHPGERISANIRHASANTLYQVPVSYTCQGPQVITSRRTMDLVTGSRYSRRVCVTPLPTLPAKLGAAGNETGSRPLSQRTPPAASTSSVSNTLVRSRVDRFPSPYLLVPS